MENRFGFRDLVISVLLIALIVAVVLAMFQYDRQWDTLKSIDSRLAEQNRALGTLAEQMRQGIRVSGVATAPTGASGAGVGDTGDAGEAPADPFYRIRKAHESPDFAHGGWFVDSTAAAVGKLTPLVAADAYQSRIESFVLESLITRDPETLEWRPWIAERWEVSDDGLTIAFDLRGNVTFADRQPLTSDDVVFTYQMIMNPEINAPALRSYYDNIEAVEAEGPHRVVFRLREPYFQALAFTGGMPILAKHYYERFTPEEFNEKPGLLFGSGPYRLAVDPEAWQPGTGAVTLVRNENYWGLRPSFDRLLWREISDPSAETVAFRNGETDILGVRPEQYERLKADENLLAKADLYEYQAPTSGYRYIGWNHRRNGEPTIFADKRVRQALTLLTNRQEMAEQLMSGLAVVADGPFNPLGTQANPEIDPYPYDPQRAIALLRDAGWTDRNGDGVLEDEQGRPFRFELMYKTPDPNYQQMAFYLKDAFARAGIVLVPAPTEWNTMIQRINERNFEATTLAWTGSVEGDPKQIFHSDSIADGGSNYVSYSNPELDALIDEAREVMDEDERLAMWHRAHAILHEDQPYTFLFFSKAVVYVDKRIRNVEITRTGMNDRTEMYIPRPLQKHAATP